MREILFRGKRNDNREWVYGFPFISSASQVGIGKWDGKAEMNSVEDDEWSRWDIYDLFVPKVDPKTVGQYTGLKDKNGMKIFENDIVFAKKDGYGEYLFVVKFGNCGGVQNVEHPVGYVGFFFEGADAYAKMSMKYGHRDDIIYHLNEYECEIVGNIHDNPELLNQRGS